MTDTKLSSETGPGNQIGQSFSPSQFKPTPQLGFVSGLNPTGFSRHVCKSDSGFPCLRSPRDCLLECVPVGPVKTGDQSRSHSNSDGLNFDGTERDRVIKEMLKDLGWDAGDENDDVGGE